MATTDNWHIHVPAPRGWECPKCGQVYAPSIAACWHCTAAKTAIPSVQTNETQTSTTADGPLAGAEIHVT